MLTDISFMFSLIWLSFKKYLIETRIRHLGLTKRKANDLKEIAYKISELQNKEQKRKALLSAKIRHKKVIDRIKEKMIERAAAGYTNAYLTEDLTKDWQTDTDTFLEIEKVLNSEGFYIRRYDRNEYYITWSY